MTLSDVNDARCGVYKIWIGPDQIGLLAFGFRFWSKFQTGFPNFFSGLSSI